MVEHDQVGPHEADGRLRDAVVAVRRAGSSPKVQLCSRWV